MEPLYRRGDRWIEQAPTHCPSGHPLLPGKVLVGSHVCGCDIHHHRTHRCRECEQVTYTPPLGEHCKDAAFDGRGRS